MTPVSDDPPTVWVAIGASAGGLEALRALARHLPNNFRAAYLVALHMAPDRASLLEEILRRETLLPVLTATDDLKPQACTIYITPPNTDIAVHDGRIRIEPLTERRASPKPSIDRLLRSLADEQGESAIGIILSGMGRDGAKGIRAIHTHGGTTIAQDEHTARYTSMPLAACETGAVDLTLAPEKIGPTLPRLMTHSGSRQDVLPPSGSLTSITALLHEHTGVNFSQYKSATVRRRVERRMAAVGAASEADYAEIVKRSASELDALFKDLMITVTAFFRDAAEFRSLRPHVERLVDERGDRTLRIWTAGVATGEEVYSLAILFADVLGGLDAFIATPIQLFATDIDVDALAVARKGLYPEAALVNLDPAMTSTYFHRSPSGYTIRKEIRDKVVFSLHDVASDPPFRDLDLISCRNVLIYFQYERQTDVFDRFHHVLRDNAVLFLGKAETVDSSTPLFSAVESTRHVFLRQSPSEPHPATRTIATKHDLAPGGSPTAGAVGADRHRSIASELDSLILALGPDALLVGDDARLLKVYGDVSPYIGLSSSGPSPRTGIDTTVGSLLRDPWEQEVRAALPAVLRRREVYEGLPQRDPLDEDRRTRLFIYPISDDVRQRQTALVVFRSSSTAAGGSGMDTHTVDVRDGDTGGDNEDGAGDEKALTGQVAELTRELEIARENLHILIEELETSNQELQAINMEMQSSNQELQSANRELELSGEELQSTNEELSAVNDELHVKARKLNALNQSQRSILDNLHTPMIVLDPELCIVDTSRSAPDYFTLPGKKMGAHLSRCLLPSGFPALEEIVATALQCRERLSRQINTASVNVTLTVSPYYDTEEKLSGVIVQVSDNTEAISAIRDELELIFAHTPAALVLCESDGKVVNANARACEWLDMDLTGIADVSIAERLPEHLHPLLTPPTGDAAPLLDETLDRSTIFALHRARQPSLWIAMRTVPFVVADSDQAMTLVVLENVTERHEEALRNEYLRTRMDLALSASDIGTWEIEIGRGDDATYWSARTRAIFGKSDDFEPSRDTFAEHIHPDDRPAFTRNLAAYSRGEESNPVRVRIVRDDGDTRWISLRGRRYVSDAGERLIGTVIDETTLIEQLEQLKAKNYHLLLAEKISGIGYWSVDTGGDGEVLWSDQVYRIHGVEQESYTPTLDSGLAFYHEDDVRRVRQHVEVALSEGSGFRFTARLRRADGELRTVRSLGLTELDGAGRTTRLFGVFRDITEADSDMVEPMPRRHEVTE